MNCDAHLFGTKSASTLLLCIQRQICTALYIRLIKCFWLERNPAYSLLQNVAYTCNVECEDFFEGRDRQAEGWRKGE